MATVTGLGGIFMRARDPEALRAWYAEHLGLRAGPDGEVVFGWRAADAPDDRGATIWSVFKQETTYFAPSASTFMVNYRVDDLEGLLAALRAAGVTEVGTAESFEYGRFGWVLDPEGNKIELWEPPAGSASPFAHSVPAAPIADQRFLGARPTLGVADVERSVAFYATHLGFEAVARMAGPPAFALLQRHAASIALVATFEPLPLPWAAVYLEVTDVRPLHRACKGAGVSLAHPLTPQPWGMLDFVLSDPDGHKIAVGQRVGGP